ncbi:hypothetical protein [Uliginosibacterium sp. TH139]|uniref:hypothetical protein n=1 Tax=Uliginosibacterium sp. TH139 TaxID=2067453 RepID=UPI000C7AA992|nr:hypothetical protein [Uliginosibacterium sp. TH139]PLK47937.1 hypothetical protein C0V76_14285 [Uliginosibacterium sp. TH139]
MRALCTISLLTVALFATPILAAEPTAASVPGGGMAVSAKFEATVVTVNLKSRKVTLRSKDGETFDLVAGAEARNLDNLRAGDQVSAEYFEAIAMQLKKVKGEAHTTAGAMVGRTPKGKKPGALFEREVQFVADVIAVDSVKKLVTVKGAAGRIVELKVEDPAKLAEVKVGDQVEGVFSQALAITVTAQAAPKTKK